MRLVLGVLLDSTGEEWPIRRIFGESMQNFNARSAPELCDSVRRSVRHPFSTAGALYKKILSGTRVVWFSYFDSGRFCRKI